MSLTLTEIARLFDAHGGTMYSGEPVTQTEHALQTAWLAEQAGADDELVTAALLHDLGHLLLAGEHGDTPTLKGMDDRHQTAVLPHLKKLFGPRVLRAIAGHVNAKRYLCAADRSYRERLSADSVRSLALQGGVFSTQQAQAFIAAPGAAEAVQLRRWDDEAKTAGLPTPDLAHYLARARRCMLAVQS